MRQGLILSDYFLFLAWIASVAIACVDIAYKNLGLLSPDVHLNLKGLNVNTETFEVILKVTSDLLFYPTSNCSDFSILITSIAYICQVLPVVHGTLLVQGHHPRILLSSVSDDH
jgi:hypothetical protein